jgi:hypothetical protein
MGLFAVVVDMLHIVFGRAFRDSYDRCTVIEDSGEQVALGLTRGLAALIRRDGTAARLTGAPGHAQMSACGKGPGRSASVLGSCCSR